MKVRTYCLSISGFSGWGFTEHYGSSTLVFPLFREAVRASRVKFSGGLTCFFYYRSLLCFPYFLFSASYNVATSGYCASGGRWWLFRFSRVFVFLYIIWIRLPLIDSSRCFAYVVLFGWEVRYLSSFFSVFAICGTIKGRSWCFRFFVIPYGCKRRSNDLFANRMIICGSCEWWFRLIILGYFIFCFFVRIFGVV